MSVMKRDRAAEVGQDWKAFVLAYGYRVSSYYLGALFGRGSEDVEYVKRVGVCTRHDPPKTFTELFTLWHGRAPLDSDWPIPLNINGYEWQPPELALLATLVGQLSVIEIARTLTARLRKLTGDPEASRSKNSIQSRINLIGMQAGDLIGGLTTKQAGLEIGSLAIINQAIEKRHLKAVRVGHRWVIPYNEWEAWKSRRTFPPEGYVLLSTLKEPLSIRSDKLSEFARAGHVPSAVRCNPYGTKGPSTQFGTWWIDPAVVKRLIADRRAGKPMPWHGQANMDNLKVTYRLWVQRKHPDVCETCRKIWGNEGTPKTFDDYVRRYPPIAHGAKRHLTMKWSPGLTLQEIAAQCGRNVGYVRRAVQNGMIATSTIGRRTYASKSDVTRWIARRCPSGEGAKSWISVETACDQYFFTSRDVRKLIDDGTLMSKVGTAGAARGVEYVLRQQCADFRAKRGFSREEAARRLGVTLDRLEHLLGGVNWRGAEGIPLSTFQAVQKRLESREGYTLAEAAEKLGTTLDWVIARKNDGTFRVARAKWDQRRLYVSAPMFERLRQAMTDPKRGTRRLSEDWLFLTDAAMEAGVSGTTLIKWAESGTLERRKFEGWWRYHREAVRACAREYWKTQRFTRPAVPEWLKVELESNDMNHRVV